MNIFSQNIERFIINRKNLFYLGLILTISLSLQQVMQGKERNFFIFAYSTVDFWKGINVYSHQWSSHYGLDYYLYGPLFNILFTPFAYLPRWLGPIVWNIFNYTLYFISIFSLPKKFSEREKCMTYLYTMLILAATQLEFQYNATVAYLFIFAYILLEKNKSFLAIVIILISGFTKIYGIFELSLLLFYPNFKKNIFYVFLISLIAFLMPLLRIYPNNLLDYYGIWIHYLGEHNITRTWDTIFYLKFMFPNPPTKMYLFQLGSLLILAIMVLMNRKRYHDENFRVQSLGILMGWVILFSSSAERHTYVIALLGYAIWYWTIEPKKVDKILFWLNFIILIVMPIDVLCPPKIMLYVHETLNLNLWLFLFTLSRMIYITLLSDIIFILKLSKDPIVQKATLLTRCISNYFSSNNH